MIWIGIDPGKSGAIAALSVHGVDLCRCDQTERDISDWLLDVLPMDRRFVFALLEQVSAMPKQGVSSTFKFGQSYGFLRGVLIAHDVPFETVTPVKWQTAMKCRSGGDKNVTKARAQELYPREKVTHAVADALLLATYCRQMRGNERAENC